MSKRIFVLLVVLMGVALLGIIAIQIFWIRSSIKMKEDQFSTNVRFALSEVSQNIRNRELKDNVVKLSPMLDSLQKSNKANVKEFFFKQIDTVKNEIFTFRQSILENNYKSQISPFDVDSLSFRTLLSKEETDIEKINFDSKDFTDLSPKDRMVKIGRLDKYDKLVFENYFKNIISRTPIYDRVGNNEIRLNLDNELRARNITTPFEYGVYDGDIVTKVKSKDFEEKSGYTYKVPLFLNNDGKSDYDLYVSFPKKKSYILSTLSRILMVSALFVLILIVAFGSALYQIIEQKKLSEIKTDFINNMTHEFKTPIATINLAVDSIKNPKIIGDKEKIIRYANMIRHENKRMHAQVENVLQISKLEKNQLDLDMDVVDVHELIEEAIIHVDLIIADRKGYVKNHFEASLSEVMGSQFHLLNVFTNILDNAIKYTEGEPKIDIYTENGRNSVIIKIADQGIGMNKNIQRKIFNKFYREQTGNIHNVKGHGLGLSYVKSIVDKHNGNIYIESEKGKGSTFIVKLPLI